MRCRWRSAHNGLASLNSNLLSSQRDTQGRAARPRFLQSVCLSGFVSISPCLPPRYSIYLTGFLSPTYFFISFCSLYPTKTCTIFLLLTLWQPQISAMNMTVMYIQSISMIDQGLSLVIDVFFIFMKQRFYLSRSAFTGKLSKICGLFTMVILWKLMLSTLCSFYVAIWS